MKMKIFLKVLILLLTFFAFSKISNAQQFYFEISTPGIKIIAGEPYYVAVPQPTVIYYEPLPRGYYCYDPDHGAYYDDYGNVYFYPSNVYVKQYYSRHDNGKHKGWHKKKHKHEREYERDDD